MINHMAGLNLTRSDAYRLLAACLYEPDKEMFLEENLCANLAVLMAELSVPVAESCRRMEQGLRENSREELLVEYSALFLGPFGALAQPYGSVYLDQERQLMGDSTMAVQRIYDEAGVKHETNGPPDHIAIELEFMSFLEQRLAQAAATNDEAAAAAWAAIESGFFAKYLATWAPLLAKAIQVHARLGFYQALNECLLGFISAEQQRLQQPMVAPSP